jgi:linalool 8-monooxygenase
MVTSSTIDLVDPNIYETAVPYEEFARLRETDPVSWHDRPDAPGYWALTRFDDIVEVSRQPAIFSSAREWGGHRLFDEDKVGLISAGDDTIGIPFISHDPPSHNQYRKFILPATSPARLGDIENRIRVRVQTLVDKIPLGEEIDIVKYLNGPLPILTLAELLGVSEDMWEPLYDWTNAFVAEDDPDYRRTPEEMARVMAEFGAFCRTLFEERRVNPTGDVSSLLANAKLGGELLPFSDFVANMILILVGGNETTRNSLSHTMMRFTEQPDQWDLILADPSILKIAVREMVRHATPVYHMRRTATQNYVLGNKSIKQGDRVIMWYVAGNRDPEKFADPDRFDIMRGNINHVGFGTGQHVCIGSRLADMQLRVAFECLAERVQSYELVEQPKRLRSNFLNGLKTLKLRLKAT